MTHPRLTLGVAYSPKTSTEQTTEFGTFENEYSLLRVGVGLEVPLLDADDPFTRGALVADVGLSQLSGDYTNRGSHRTQGELGVGWRQNFLKYLHVEGRATAGYGNVAFNSGRGYEPEEEDAFAMRYTGLLGVNGTLPDGSDILPQFGFFYEHDLSGPVYSNQGVVMALTIATNFLGGGGNEGSTTRPETMNPEQVFGVWRDARPKDSPELQRLRELQQEVREFDQVLAKSVAAIISAYEEQGITPEGNFEIKRLNTLIEQMLAKDKVLGFPMIIPFAENHPDLALQVKRDEVGDPLCYSEPRLDYLASVILLLAKNTAKKNGDSNKTGDGKEHNVVFKVNIESYVHTLSAETAADKKNVASARAQAIEAYLTRQGKLSHLREVAQGRQPALAKDQLDRRIAEAVLAEQITTNDTCNQSINDGNRSVSTPSGTSVVIDVDTRIVENKEAMFDAVVLQLEVIVDGEVLKGKKRTEFLTSLIGDTPSKPGVGIF